jgi:antitoxin ParD1/3/4
MSKNTSILLGDYFNESIKEQIRSGRYGSASEVVRSALRFFEQEDQKRKELIKALEKGEVSGFVDDFDKERFLQEMRKSVTE